MNKSKIAAFDVDAQKGFTPLCPNELPVPDGDKIVESLNFMGGIADIRVASKDSHAPNAAWVVETPDQMLKPTGIPDADLTWVSHCVPGTKGHELLDGLPSCAEYDFMVYKGIEPDMHPYGACYHDLADTRSTGVIEFLKSKYIETVVVGGLALEYCVATTAKQLKNAGFDVVVYLPATRPLDPNAGIKAVQNLEIMGVSVATCPDDLIQVALG